MDAEDEGVKLLSISEENELCVWTELDEPTSYGDGAGPGRPGAAAGCAPVAGLAACWAAPMSEEPYEVQRERATSR